MWTDGKQERWTWDHSFIKLLVAKWGRPELCSGMALNEFEKEEALQRTLIGQRMDDCDVTDADQCQSLAQDAARLAYERFFRFRFGGFVGTDHCVVFSNMGSESQSARDRFLRVL